MVLKCWRSLTAKGGARLLGGHGIIQTPCSAAWPSLSDERKGLPSRLPLREARIFLRWHVSKPSSMRTLPSTPFQTTQHLISVMKFPTPSYKDICALTPGYSAIVLDLSLYYSLHARCKTNEAHHLRTTYVHILP